MATITRSGWTPLLLIICLTSTLGTTIPVGYFFGVLNAPAEVIKQWCQDILANEYDTVVAAIEVLWASIVSIFLIGGMCGSCFSAWCSDKYGRKGSLLISSVLFILAAVLFACCRSAKSLEMLMVARFLGGIASALIFTAQPMYLLELAPTPLRGSVGVFTCIGVTAGILLAQIVSLPQFLGDPNNWPYALSFYVLPVLVTVIPMCWFPESPRWLYLLKKDIVGSELALQRLRGANAAEEIQCELSEMEAMLDQTNAGPRTLCAVLRDKELHLPLILVCSFLAAQQLCGCLAIFYYSMSIFTEAGFTTELAVWLSLGIGSFNLCVSLLGPLLLYKYCRRPLMLSSCAVCALSLLCISFGLYYMDEVKWLSQVCIAFILIFILGFQLGLGPIPYFVGSELLEVSPRPVAMSMGSFFSWTANFLLGMCFPLLQSVWSSFAFLPCVAVCIYCFLLTWRYLPETRGREPADVKSLMNNGLRSQIK